MPEKIDRPDTTAKFVHRCSEANAADVVARLVWTDANGLIHERKPGEWAARCGAEYDASPHRGKYPRPCQPCIDDSFREYTLEHDCRESGCVVAAVEARKANRRPIPSTVSATQDTTG